MYDPCTKRKLSAPCPTDEGFRTIEVWESEQAGNTSRPSGSLPRSRPSAGRRDQNRPSAVFARRTSLSGLQSPKGRLYERVPQ